MNLQEGWCFPSSRACMAPQDLAKGMKEKPVSLSLSNTGRFPRSVCLRLTCVFALLLMETSCATPRQVKTTDAPEIKASGKTSDYSDCQGIEKRIRDEYGRWKGTRHRLGATGQGGIDCSGFVQAVYRNAFNMALPRTTKEQVKQGIPVKRHQLQAGDLVFFKPPGYPRHVGIFLRGKAFVHASKKKGVIISEIDPHYWGKYYWTARRIFPTY